MQTDLCVDVVVALTGDPHSVLNGLLGAVLMGGVGGVDGYDDGGIGARIEVAIVLPSTLRADCRKVGRGR